MAKRNMLTAISILFFGIVFASLLGVVVFQGWRQWRESRRNDREPVQTVNAKVLAKRSVELLPPKDHNPKITWTPSVKRYVTFQTDQEAPREFEVPVEDYQKLTEGQTGTLRHQGTRYLGFEASSPPR